MRKIINGKAYDTETATRLSGENLIYSYGRTNMNELFVAGEDGYWATDKEVAEKVADDMDYQDVANGYHLNEAILDSLYGHVNGYEYVNESLGWCHNRTRDVFAYEHLYRKKNGEFFCTLEFTSFTDGAGAYANDMESSWLVGIKPITESKAKEWAEEHLDTEEYEELFGKVEE